MDKPIITWQKNVEKTTNKMRIPKQVIESLGNSFLLHLMPNGTLILEPTKKENRKEK